MFNLFLILFICDIFSLQALNASDWHLAAESPLTIEETRCLSQPASISFPTQFMNNLLKERQGYLGRPPGEVIPLQFIWNPNNNVMNLNRLSSLKDIFDKPEAYGLRAGKANSYFILCFAHLGLTTKGEFYWRGAPAHTKPSDKVRSELENNFGSYEEFKEAFDTAVKGAGYAWLIKTCDGDLVIANLPQNTNPYMANAEVRGIPVLMCKPNLLNQHTIKQRKMRESPSDYTLTPLYPDLFWDDIDWLRVEEILSGCAD